METVITDRDGDILEIVRTDKGLYITVEQGNILATVGPLSQDIRELL